MRRLLTVLVAAAIALPAMAQDLAPPRFFIERIEVRNAHRVSAELVVSETRLREGAEYSEADLASASARLGRLPFLTSADFALTKGSERGRHVLVITIAETKPFFFLLDSRPILTDSHGPTRIEYADDAGSETKDAALGFRWFVGRRGIVHAGVMRRNDRHVFTRSYSAVAAGYTRYDLFGSGAFATVNVRLPEGRWAHGTVSPQIVVGVPLSTTQSLTLNYEDTYFKRDKNELRGLRFDERDAERLLSLTWTYNTTNDPFAPTRGTIVRVSPLRSMRDVASARFFAPVTGSGQPEAFAEHINGYGIDLLGSRYWELSERNAVFAGAVAGWAGVEDRLNAPGTFGFESRWRPVYEVVRGGYSRSLGRSRLEFEGRYIARQFHHDRSRSGVAPNKEAGYQATASWVRRSSWGSLRLGLGYAWGF